MPSAPSSLPLPVIAVLGTGAPAFIRSVEQALSASALPHTPSLVDCATVPQAATADLRWLLAWTDEDGLNDLEAQQAIRAALHAQGLAYQVLRGTPTERLQQALHSLAPWLPALAATLPQTGVRSRRPGWSCSECSDPECEHLSFRQLLADRQD